MSYFFSLPWDQSTLYGYSAQIAFSIIINEAYMIANGAPLLLFISICLHHRAFYQMFLHSVCKLNCADEKQNDLEVLIQLIRFHMTIKE